MLRKGGCLTLPEVAERVNAWWQYSSETNYIGSSLGLFRVMIQSGCVVQTQQWASGSSCVYLSTVYSGAAVKEEERQDYRSPKHHRVCIRPTVPTYNSLSHTQMDPRDTATGWGRNKYGPNRRPKTSCFLQIHKWRTYAPSIAGHCWDTGIPTRYRWVVSSTHFNSGNGNAEG